MKHQNVIAFLVLFLCSVFSLGSQAQAAVRLQDQALTATKEEIGSEPAPIGQPFGAAANKISPLVIDLDGDGVETISIKAGAYFDYDGNGFAEQTGWASPDDGILVCDKNGNGKIDSGRELFGSYAILKNGQQSKNGFQALAEYDQNHDGMITPQDTATWSTLLIWRDTHGDGYSRPDELHTLEELGIASINTSYTEATIEDSSGNDHREIGSITTKDGQTLAMDDVWVHIDTMHTIANDWLRVSPDIVQLPELKGYGNVYGLHQAMARDTGGNLKSLVKAFVSSTDSEIRNGLMTQILEAWTETADVSRDSRGPNIDGRRLAILEKFFGEPFYQKEEGGSNPSPDRAIRLQQSYTEFFEMFHSQLMAQTHLKPLFDKIRYTKDEAGCCKGDMNVVAADLLSRIEKSASEGKTLLSEFVRAIKGSRKEAMVDFVSFRSAFEGKPELLLIIDTAEKVSETKTEAP